MTVKRVAEEFFKPYTKEKGDYGLTLEGDVYVISQSDDNEFGPLVQALIKHFDDADRARVHILIDLFAIDQTYSKSALQEELRQVRASVIFPKEGKLVCPSREMELLDEVSVRPAYMPIFLLEKETHYYLVHSSSRPSENASRRLVTHPRASL